jgi:hypothetical protein
MGLSYDINNEESSLINSRRSEEELEENGL